MSQFRVSANTVIRVPSAHREQDNVVEVGIERAYLCPQRRPSVHGYQDRSI